MSASLPEVAVIIPTRADRARAELLLRAVDCVAGQENVRAVPTVVVNGGRSDPTLVERLRADSRVRLVELEEEGIPGALLAGRRAVDAPWFSDLDDDDLLMPGALALRVRALERRPDCCAVVTNGIRRSASGDALNIPDHVDVGADPARAMIHRNWFLAGGYLCRSEAVGPEMFEGMPRYLERTYQGLWLATSCTIAWLKEPTVIYHQDTPESEWGSRPAVLGQADALRAILELPLPAEVRRDFQRRIPGACHAASDYELQAGSLREAWIWHVRSLAHPGGWRHVPFTARIAAAFLRLRVFHR